MIKDEIRSILKSLLERTKAKQVSWSPSEGSDLDIDDYIVSFPNSGVNIIMNNQGRIWANILNSNGSVVACLSDDESPADISLLAELLNSAKESATKIDETLEDLRRALAS